MASTKQLIRQKVADRSGWYKLISATSGTTTALVDNIALKDTGGSDYEYVDWWIKCIDAVNTTNEYKVRRIASYSKTSGTITFGNAFPAAISAGDDFELHQINPDVIDAAINDALRRCTTTKITTITYSAGETMINLTSQLSWVTARENLLKLRYKFGTVANKYSFQDIPPYQYRLTVNDGVVTAEFRETMLHGTGIAMEAVTIGPYLVLDSEFDEDTDTTNCPLDWIVAMATVEVLNRIAKNADIGGRATIRMDRNEAVNDALQQTERFAPAISYQMTVEE